MSHIADQAFLKNDQYKDSSNLQARIDLHERFSTSPQKWPRWVFDQISLAPGCRVLDAGCGSGSLWTSNLERLPEHLGLILSDLSIGMARNTRRLFKDRPGFRFLNLDAQALPFVDGDFDTVIANHMLYHVPNIDLALTEFRRVLKLGGKLFAATNGLNHLTELDELIRSFAPSYHDPRTEMNRYALENAAEILGRHFERVKVLPFDDNLIVTQVEPLLAYIFSMWSVADAIGPEQRPDFEVYLRQRFATHGSFFIRKSGGLVVAW